MQHFKPPSGAWRAARIRCAAARQCWPGTVGDRTYDLRAKDDDSFVSRTRTAMSALPPKADIHRARCDVSLFLRKGHPFANDFSARLAVFHVRDSLGYLILVLEREL